MKKRGNVVRAPRDGPGLLMIEGQQLQFSMDGMWRSEVPPTTGLLVEVELNHEAVITAITPVPGSRQLRGIETLAHDRQQTCTGFFKQLLAKLLARDSLQNFQAARRNPRKKENS